MILLIRLDDVSGKQNLQNDEFDPSDEHNLLPPYVQYCTNMLPQIFHVALPSVNVKGCCAGR